MDTSLQTRMRRLFVEAFTVMDIAEPLVSFDAGSDAEEVRAFMEERGLQLVGVRRDGVVAGYTRREELATGSCGDHLRPFSESEVVFEGASFPRVLEALIDSRYCFVSILGSVGAIVSRSDVEKPPVRMWLFGMITILEMFVTRSVQELYPDGSWAEEVSEGRLRKAQGLQKERERRGQSVDLLDCLQLSDKAAVLMKKEAMREDFGFESRREGERAIQELASLRNDLAHAQDIVSHNWEAIVNVSRRLDKIMTRV